MRGSRGRGLVAIGSVVLGAGLTVALSDVADAQTNGVLACTHYVYDPAYGVNVWVTGGRAGCTNSISMKMQLKKDLLLQPDPVIAEVSGSGVNYYLRPARSCSSAGIGIYYGRLEWDGGNSKKEGNHVEACR